MFTYNADVRTMFHQMRIQKLASSKKEAPLDNNPTIQPYFHDLISLNQPPKALFRNSHLIKSLNFTVKKAVIKIKKNSHE